MEFLGIAVVINSKCNAKCAHCFGSYGPRRSEQLSADTIRSVIDQAKELPSIARDFAVAGGEVFLYWPKLLETIRHAATSGFTPSITTNGFWATTPERARRLIRELVDAGLEKFEISVDQFHQDFIPIERIKNLLAAAKEVGVPTIMLRCHSTRSQRLDDSLKALDLSDLVGTVVVCAPVIPMGRALTDIDPELIYADAEIPRGSCLNGLVLTINVIGDVFPCCAGSELCPPLKLGNVLVSPLKAILDEASRNYVVQALVRAGPTAFLPVIEASGLAGRLPGRYASICDLCHRVFTDQALAGAVTRSVDRRRQEIADRIAIAGTSESYV